MLNLRTKSNPEIFDLWRGELAFRYRSQYALNEAYRIIGGFEKYLGNFPPSAELAKSYLSQFLNKKTSTLARYTNAIAQFMKWYGDPLDVTIRRPKQLPQLTEPKDSDRLVEFMRGRKTHKKKAERDILLVEAFRLTGLRRAEMANMKVGDIDFVNKVLVVRSGKGEKDRSIPLSANLSTKLERFCQGKDREDLVFGLAPVSISDKIRAWAIKAGCPHIHVHSLRHEFATELARQGVDARRIQMLLGHSSMETSQQYIDLVADDLRNAIEQLDRRRTGQPVPEQVKKQEGEFEKLGLIPEQEEIMDQAYINNECPAPPDDVDVSLLESWGISSKKSAEILSNWRTVHIKGEHEKCKSFRNLEKDLKVLKIPFVEAIKLLNAEIEAQEIGGVGREGVLADMDIKRKYRPWESDRNYKAFIKEIQRIHETPENKV